eukprot:3941119-Prymnesium_polylepis.1
MEDGGAGGAGGSGPLAHRRSCTDVLMSSVHRALQRRPRRRRMLFEVVSCECGGAEPRTACGVAKMRRAPAYVRRRG